VDQEIVFLPVMYVSYGDISLQKQRIARNMGKKVYFCVLKLLLNVLHSFSTVKALKSSF
jgi:hypothetical protein